MTHQELCDIVVRQLGHVPTTEQREAIDVFARFMGSGDDRSVMLLRGAAGTGKTTLAAAIVMTLSALGHKLVLMAPTGRAAKVFALYANHEASTIHRCLYRQQTSVGLGTFSLQPNLRRDTLFIVDEASMIANGNGMDTGLFGTGCLLDDLMSYVYQGEGCRLLLIGDQAQLPPVGQVESPALSPEVVSGYGVQLYVTALTEVLRQSQQSGILWNATQVRMLMDDCRLPRIRVSGFSDVVVVRGDELIEQMASSYSMVGQDETIVVTRSNKRANIYNQGIRRSVLDREDELCRGDQLMIVKNNYHVPPSLGFLANGDRCVVQRVRRVHELYGFRFAEVTLQLPDYDDQELTCTTLLDTLTTEAPALTREQQERLFDGVMADYADVPRKADRMKKLKEDAHYNALQVKYGYAVTCHKAQGGQWAHVYIDQGYMTDDMLTPDYLHWLYTALTRATEKVFLVNWPGTQTEE